MEFYDDRVEYWFNQTEYRKVRTTMYYADMADVRADAARRVLSFRIAHTRGLEYFTMDYRPDEPRHRVSIGFDSEHDFGRVVAQVLPVVRRVAPR